MRRRRRRPMAVLQLDMFNVYPKLVKIHVPKPRTIAERRADRPVCDGAAAAGKFSRYDELRAGYGPVIPDGYHVKGCEDYCLRVASLDSDLLWKEHLYRVNFFLQSKIFDSYGEA